jgi:hypothetical protein
MLKWIRSNSMAQSPWEAISHSVSEEISWLIIGEKESEGCNLHAITILISYHLSLTASDCLTTMFYICFISSMHATHPAYHIFLDLITIITHSTSSPHRPTIRLNIILPSTSWSLTWSVVSTFSNYYARIHATSATCPDLFIYSFYYFSSGARGSVVSWGTMLQAWRSRIRFSMRSLNFSIELIIPVALWPWGSLSF